MRHIPDADLRRIVTPAFATDGAAEAYRIFGREGDVASRPSAAVTVIASDPPRSFMFKGGTSLELNRTGHQMGVQFGEMYFLVYDSQTGELVGLLDHRWLNKRRTGATGAVVARRLANPGARIAAVIGAGEIGEEVVRCLDHLFDFEEIRISSRTAESAQRFAARLAPDLKAPIRAVASGREAVEDADVVVTITIATAPVLQPGWLKPGAVVCAMGGAPEVDFGVLSEMNAFFIDDIGYAMLRGSIAGWMASGRATEAEIRGRIDATVGDLFAGRHPGRRSADERILAVVQGMALCDLVIADRALAQAAAEGCGTEMHLPPQGPQLDREELSRRTPAIVAALRDRRPTR